MNIKKSITSLIIIVITLGLFIPSQITTAQEAIQRPTKPEKGCEDLKPNFGIMYNNLDLKTYNFEIYNTAFNDARDAYHKYVECIFNYAEVKILGGVGVSKGTMQANTPNFDPSETPIISPGIEWMTSAACLTHTELNKIIDDTSPNQMLYPLLETYNSYTDHLDKLINLYSFLGEEGGELTLQQQLDIKTRVITSATRKTDTEKQNALVAMNITFASLKELRLAFVMHVHFQCILNNLDKYRKKLEDVRIIVDSLPFELQDASMLCQ
jgi:hypothetical protein